MNFHSILNIETLQIMKSILKQQIHNPNFCVPLVIFQKHKGTILSNVHIVCDSYYSCVFTLINCPYKVWALHPIPILKVS
jgi:hypothetical protein